MMKTVLVTGSNGLLGQKITERILAHPQFNLIATSKGADRFPQQVGYKYVSMDILDPKNVQDVLAACKPDAVIHTAAMTNVDTCQQQQEQALALNVEAVKTLVKCCEAQNIHLVHLSTDFVFDGEAGPYDESAQPNPLSYYGETKVASEKVVAEAGCAWTIIRTILVYGIVGDMSRSNIVLWAKGALEKGAPLQVVNDQWRMPTLAEDLADSCLLAVAKEAQGLFHISGKDMMTVADIVRRVAAYWKLDDRLITEVSADTFTQSARRPARTGFILDKAKDQLGYQPHSFEEGLALMDKQMAAIAQNGVY